MKNKSINLINNVMPKLHSIFTKDFTIFFSNVLNTGSVPEFK